MAFKGFSRRDALLAGLGVVASPARAAPQERTVKVVMGEGLNGLTLHELAKRQGFFEEADVDPTVLAVADGSKCVAALLGGASDICIWSGFNQVTAAIEKGAPIKILAGALLLPSLAFVSAHPEIRNVEQLENKTIGIGAPGSVVHQMSAYLLKKKGIDLDKLTFRNVGANQDIFKAIAARTVDAGFADVGDLPRASRLGVHLLEGGKAWIEIPEYTNQASYAAIATARDKRDLLVRLLSAYGRAYRFVQQKESRGPYLSAMAAVLGRSDEEQGLARWNWFQEFRPYDQDLLLSDARIDLVQQLNVEFQVQSKVLPISKVSDNTLARDALKLLR